MKLLCRVIHIWTSSSEGQRSNSQITLGFNLEALQITPGFNQLLNKPWVPAPRDLALELCRRN